MQIPILRIKRDDLNRKKHIFIVVDLKEKEGKMFLGKSFPNIYVRVNYILINVLSEGCDLKVFEKNVKEFTKFFSNYKKLILTEICKAFGEEWKEKDITIYPLPKNAKVPSLGAPLLLKIRKNPKLTLYFLIHELIHRFIGFNKNVKKKIDKLIGYEKGLMMEAFVVYVTKVIFSKIFGKKLTEKMRNLERKIVKSRDERKCEELISRMKKRFSEILYPI
jgi:hypothetical protein